MGEVCDFHKEAMAKLDGTIARSTLKWVATIFAIPTMAAVLTTWAFIASADYRFGSQMQAEANKAKIALLDERTIMLRNDLLKAQENIASDITIIKLELKDISKELMRNRKP